MSYVLFWRSPALPYAQKQAPINVPNGTVVSNAASIRFTGKGATNYGTVQQENLIRLLENFAGPLAPDYPTVGQTWYDTALNVLKVCISTAPSPVLWSQLKSTQVTGIGEPPPFPAVLGDTWFSITGSASGILYTYTGVGRYPQKQWSATTSGYWPAPATFAAIKLNYGDFVTPNFSECFIHGFTSGTPDNVPGSIVVNGATVALPNASVVSEVPGVDLVIIYDRNAVPLVPAGFNSPYAIVRQSGDNRWFFDNNSTLVEFTPNENMIAIGRITVAEHDDQTAPGISSASLWATGIPLTNFQHVPDVVSNGAIGGWEQVWPTVETVGGRAEYDYVYDKLAALIGDPVMHGGSGAEGRSILNLTPFRTLDASLYVAWKNAMPPDTNVAPITNGEYNKLRVSPNSQDWDKLLSACRYALNRIELPNGMIDDLSTQPFVQDGRIGDPSIYSLPSNDVRTLPTDRKYNIRAGLMSLFSAYQETINVLRAAIQNRYVLRGILGSSGVTSTGALTTAVNHASYSSPASSLVGTVSHGLRYEFASTGNNIEGFFYSGQALELKFTHVPISNTAADITLKTIADNFGRIRITANATYVMSPSPTPALAQAPGTNGFNQITAAGVALATLSSGSSSMIIRAVKSSASAVDIFIDITGGGALTGTFTAFWGYISDTETYTLGAVYPKPLTNVTATHKLGSSVFV